MTDLKAIGIDLGTTYCRVAVFKNGRIEVLTNEIASNLTPSYVSFTEKLCLVGDSAKNQVAMNAKNTICGIRRLIGRKYSNNIPGSKYWPFRVNNDEKRAKIFAQYRGKTKELCPEQIALEAREDVRVVLDKIVAWLGDNNDADKEKFEVMHQRYRDLVQEAVNRPMRFIDERREKKAPIPKQYPDTAHPVSSVKIEERKTMADYAIGIDLGTTYSCVGVVKDGKVKIIHNDCGLTTTASFVAFTETERLIGDPAKSQGIKNFQNTVFDVKRLIGRKFENKTIQDDIKQLPFKVVEVHGRCGVEVQFKGKTKIYSTEELSAMVLTKMKETAEAFLRQPVKNAVITVPAYFNGTQRQATKDAAAIAGLNVLQIINEPTAAGIAYGLDEKTPNRQNILIYDLGGGTFDVTIMTIENKNFTVISTSGDTHLGGEDFDSCLVDYCVADIKKNYKVDITANKLALRTLRKACEDAKRTLSSETQTTIEVDGLVNGEDFSLEIGRSRFEELCFHLFSKILVFVEKALDDAHMTKKEIDEMIMVGGSTRIPRMRQLLTEQLFKQLFSQGTRRTWYKIQDVTSMTLGLDTTAGNFHRIVMKNTFLPTRKTGVQCIGSDYQEVSAFGVYEGENDHYKENDFLGEFKLHGIRKAPKGKVIFEIDEDGILDVQATERGTKNMRNIRIIRNTGSLSKEDIVRMTMNEAEFVVEDKALMYR